MSAIDTWALRQEASASEDGRPSEKAGGEARPGLELSSKARTMLLFGILAVAFLLRLGGVFHDLPFSYFGDELHLMKRAMVMGTGDLNPHWFHKPAFLMYLLLGAYGTYFAAGYVIGRFESVDHFAAHFLSDYGPFLLIGRLIVLVFGVMLVYVVYRLGRRLADSPLPALVGAMVAAVTPPLVAASQTIKADIPCAFFVVLALLLYVRDLELEGASLKPLVLACLTAGVAMGTKYYGVILVPTFLVWELGRAGRRAIDLRTLLKRGTVIVVCFLLGFVVVSPFNFIDPTWLSGVAVKIPAAAGIGIPETITVFEIDSKIEYRPGPAAWVGATGDFIKRLFDRQGLGLPLALAFAAGLLATWSNRRVRGYGALIALPVVFFLAFSVIFNPYHARLRHLTAVIPLICLFTWPGATAVSSLLARSERIRAILATAMVVIVVLPSLGRSIAANVQLMREDARNVAYAWVLKNLPVDARLLVEDDGPIFQPDLVALDRLEQRLAKLPRGPFVVHEGRRLDLLSRYQPTAARNIDVLGRPWWLRREKSDEKIRQSSFDLEMSNPLITRTPLTLDEYRSHGIRFIVQSSVGERWLAGFEDPELRFPSFVRFYDALDQLEPVQTFDPKSWKGRGPVIRVFDLSREQEDPEGA